MSELKAVHAFDVYEAYTKTGDDDAAQVYLKSEADKVIADLEESHKNEVEQLLIEIAELKKEKEYTVEHTAEVINGQDRELHHQKYRRCLAMAEWCDAEADVADADGDYEDMQRYQKWHERWLELAEKLKTNSTAHHGKEEAK